MNWIFETERLGFRQFAQSDFAALCKILQDEEVMYAWEHGFSEEEVRVWINRNLTRYNEDGFSYYAALEKSTGELIGAIGPLAERVEGESHIGVAYIVDKAFWGRGYATEGARASMEYAFKTLGASRVIAEIRPENQASCRVAERLGMTVEGQFVKLYCGKEMPHLIYAKRRSVAAD